MVPSVQVTDRPADMIDMREAIATGRATASALIDEAIERLEAVNPQLNLIAWRTYDRARERAEAAQVGPLAGVPTMIKDHIDERGLPNSFGSAALRDHIASADGPYTKAILDSGVISICRSAMPELGLNAVTESPLVGPTRNPWNLDHTPGGSSGGSAAAVAAGVVPIAHASDGLGSIRHGAAPCGLIGLKPSRGRNCGDEAMKAMLDLAVHGCVSRTVRDTAAWFDATQSRSADAAFAPAARVTAALDSRLTIRAHCTVMRTGERPGTGVDRVFDDACGLLDRLGHRVIDTALPFAGEQAIADLGDIITKRFPLSIDRMSQAIGRRLPVEQLEHRSRTILSAAATIEDEQLAEALTRMEGYVRRYLDQFETCDIWMAPTMGRDAVPIGTFGPNTDWSAQLDDLLDFAGLCWIDNFAGTPSISLPMGFSDNGLPIGIQFATRPGGEPLLLALAYQLEAAIEWWRRTPPIWVGDK